MPRTISVRLRPGRQAQASGRGGFTLVEIMVVVAVIMVILVIAIPNFLQSWMRANESAAVANLTAIRNGCQSYYAQATPHAYPGNLTVISTGNTAYINNALAGNGSVASLQGYDLAYTSVNSGDGFTLTARPRSYGVTGMRSFYTDQSGVLTATTQNQAAGPGDAGVQ